jgi:valyl-tRNA synthetase
VAYFATQGDATAGTSPLTSPFNTTSATLWAVVTNAATGCRSVAVPVSILIEPLVTPVIDNTSNTICVEWGTGVLLSGLTLHSDFSGNAGYTLEWFYQGQSVGVGDTYTISDPLAFGDYTVVATSTSALGCVSQVSQVFNVVRSGPAVAAAGTIGYSVSDAFDGGQTITVSVEGYGAGTYYYQLDNGPILDNGGVFTNVPPCSQLEPGVCDHQVTIYDYAGIGDEHCDPLVIGDIHSIDYPRFFTPNGDGINDQWNITGLADDQNSKIYIFDRYGKLLKQIKPGVPSQGWDGTLNGEPLPSTDYWFVVYYTENGAQKEFKAHFSLKR